MLIACVLVSGLVGGCPVSSISMFCSSYGSRNAYWQVLPIYAGRIQCAWLGVALAAYNEAGSPVKVGEGDLVITKPMPFMPLGFLGDDENNSKLKDAYFNHYEDQSVWYHADHSKHERHAVAWNLMLLI